MKYFVTASLILLFVVTSAQAQARRGTVVGQVYEQGQGIPMQYANVMVFSAEDSIALTGTTSNNEGVFEIPNVPTGRYYVEVQFMGYRKHRSATFRIAPPDFRADLGKISLSQTALTLEGVVVEGEPPAISYQIDKKVIDVSQQQTALSGTAVDVLENVPSVTVDIEGNVSLRGSSNFTVLIDGRTTVLDPAEALEQIPASSIENIEIITNPSAKYSPEGTAGIINVVMKKNERKGRSAVLNMDAGLNEKYGGDILVETNSGAVRTAVGVDYRQRNYSGDDFEMNRTSSNAVTSFVESDGTSDRMRERFGLRGEIEWTMNSSNIVSFGGRFGNRDNGNEAAAAFQEWSDPGTTRSFYSSRTERGRGGHFLDLNANYEHTFGRKDHELSLRLKFEYDKSDESTLNELRGQDNEITSGRLTTERGPGKEFEAKLDYTRPSGEDGKFEAGFHSESEISRDVTGFYEYEAGPGDYVLRPLFSNKTDYTEHNQALYAIRAGKLNRLGYQFGLRAEYTYRTVEVSGLAEPFKIDRWDYFPTVHTSFEFSENQQFMASYTRRIDRPGGWRLEPFLTWMDAYNVRQGNPDLKPEYIDSYETGLQTTVGKTLFNTEVYYRVNHNKIERVQSVFDENVTLHSTQNVGTDYSLGTEALVNPGWFDDWEINLIGNVYHYRIKGVLYDEAFERSSFNWGLRMSNMFRIGKNTRVQLNGRYHSPSVSSQGRREAFFVTDFAFRQDFFQRRVSATLQIRDLLGTAKYEYESEGQGFYRYNHSTRESPVVMLNLKYNFNKRNNNDERRDQGPPDDGGGGMEDF